MSNNIVYTNSPLACVTNLSPNHSGKRTHALDRITPHCVVGQATAERIGEIFAPTARQASCNYGIGKDGRIILVCEEKNRSWCTSSKENDQRAITIEVASDSKHPYAFKPEAYNALIELCIDICRRYGKKKLLWLADKNKTLAYKPAEDEMVLSVHRWFANKSCPGDWMYSRMGDLAEKVTAALGGTATPDASVTPDTPATPDTSTLKKGDSGEAVKTVQTMLIACGYDCGSTGADGKFGDKTLTALKAFQKASGLTVDGLYGSATKAALEKAYANRPSVSTPTATPSREQTIWDTLFAVIGNAYGVAGLMGNLYAESALNPQNLQNTGNNKLGMTDAEFTEAFDSGKYTADTFIHDGYGYGLAQWTYYSRKQALLNYAKAAGKSIGDLTMQLGFLLQEIKGYKTVWNTICNAASVHEASDVVLLKYERPANTSESVQIKRAGYGQKYYDKYAKTATTPAAPADPVTPTTPEVEEGKDSVPAITTKYYRVRKSWADKASQIGAYTVFQNAKNAVNANPGYAAFADDGTQVYPVVEKAPAVETPATKIAFPYLVRITNKTLNYRKGPSVEYDTYGYIKPGIYTIVEEQNGWGLLKGYAKYRNGWVCLKYTEKMDG